VRVAIVADSHFSERSRFDECVRIHDWIADDVAARGADLVLHAGDLYDSRSTPAERRAAADWIRRIAERAPVVIVRGNHDSPGDLPLLARLRTRHPVVVEEAAAVHVAAGVAVACLAWPQKGRLLAAGGSDAGAALRAVLAGLGDGLAAHDGPRVLLSHAMVSGSTTSTGQPLAGVDMEMGLADLALAGAGFVALGHIHMPQDWAIGSADGANAPVVYPGSPRRTAFGEVEDKGYVVVDFAPGGSPPSWTRVATPATPMLLLEAAWDVEAQNLVGVHRLADVAGAEVRFRYGVPADQRDAAKARAEQFRRHAVGMGAVRVQVEEAVDAAARARAPEIAGAQSTAD